MSHSRNLLSKLVKFLCYGTVALAGSILLLSVIINVTLHELGYYVNLSDSLPHGVYKAHYVKEPESMFSLNQNSTDKEQASKENTAPAQVNTAITPTENLATTSKTNTEKAPQIKPTQKQDESTPTTLASTQAASANSLENKPQGTLDFGSKSIDLPVTRDQLVLVCLDSKWTKFASDRGYIGTGKCPDHSAPVGKWIVAIPGDTVEFTADGIMVNQELIINSQPSLKDGQGRDMPELSGTRTLQEHEVVLCNPLLSSFDSRYFGPVNIQQIHATLSPVWLWTQEESIELEHAGL